MSEPVKSRRPWTPEEDALIREHYPMEAYKLLVLLPDRSQNAIRRHAEKLGLSKELLWACPLGIQAAQSPSQCRKITAFRDIPKFTRDGSYAVDYPIDRLVKWIEEEQETAGLQLNPDFQRGHVWTVSQQIAYMEFLLRGGKTGRVLYFNCPSWHRPVPDGAYNDYVCVDGLQRITAITRFIHNEIPAFGSYYSEFTDSPRVIEDTMRVNINDLKSKREVLQWYIDMNAGGTPHTPAEIARVQQLLQESED